MELESAPCTAGAVPHAGAVVRLRELTIVVPVYGNAGTLPELAARLGRAAAAVAGTHRIWFVDDASPDASAAVMAELRARDPHIAVLHLARNVGQHRAVRLGLERVTPGSTVVVMDADLQDPPEAIVDLAAHAAQGFDIVFAGRRGKYQSRGRMLTSALFKRVLHWLCGVPVDAGMYFLMSGRALAAVLRLGGERPWIVASLGHTRLPMTSIPVRRACRNTGASAYSSRARLASALRALMFAVACKLRARAS